jgi:hypothetical protein
VPGRATAPGGGLSRCPRGRCSRHTLGTRLLVAHCGPNQPPPQIEGRDAPDRMPRRRQSRVRRTSQASTCSGRRQPTGRASFASRFNALVNFSPYAEVPFQLRSLRHLTHMPNTGRCTIAYLFACLHIADTRSGTTRLIVRIGTCRVCRFSTALHPAICAYVA